MNINAIIFDLDGTLLNTLEDLKNSVNYALNKRNHPLRTLEEIRCFIGNGVRILITRSLPVNSSVIEIENCLDIFSKHYTLHMNDNTRVYDGIINMLAALKEKNIKMAIVSNKNNNCVKELCDKYFYEYIDIAVGTPKHAKKPDPFSVNEVIGLLNSSIETTIYVGDSEVDILTAHNAFLRCVGVSWGFRDRIFLENHNCDYIIDNPMELFRLLKI